MIIIIAITIIIDTLKSNNDSNEKKLNGARFMEYVSFPGRKTSKVSLKLDEVRT